MAKNFKPGQKVVFKYNGKSAGYHIIPQNNTVLTIVKEHKNVKCSWIVYEFPFDKDGKIQSFDECVLFPLEEKQQTVTLSIKKIKLEPKKVLEEIEVFEN